MALASSRCGRWAGVVGVAACASMSACVVAQTIAEPVFGMAIGFRAEYEQTAGDQNDIDNPVPLCGFYLLPVFGVWEGHPTVRTPPLDVVVEPIAASFTSASGLTLPMVVIDQGEPTGLPDIRRWWLIGHHSAMSADPEQFYANFPIGEYRFSLTYARAEDGQPPAEITLCDTLPIDELYFPSPYFNQALESWSWASPVRVSGASFEAMAAASPGAALTVDFDFANYYIADPAVAFLDLPQIRVLGPDGEPLDLNAIGGAGTSLTMPQSRQVEFPPHFFQPGVQYTVEVLRSGGLHLDESISCGPGSGCEPSAGGFCAAYRNKLFTRITHIRLVTLPRCPGDFSQDGDVNPDDLGDFINCYFAESATPGTCPRADFNRDGNVDPDDLGDFTNAYLGACDLYDPPLPSPAPPTLPPGLAISPTVGGLGTVVSIEVTGPTVPDPRYTFEAATTATWTGRYVEFDPNPVTGLPAESAEFTINFPAGLLRADSATKGHIVIGEGGWGAYAPPLAVLGMGPGFLRGTISVNFFGGGTLTAPAVFSPITTAARWRHRRDGDTWYGPAEPYLAEEPTEFEPFPLGDHPNPLAPDAEILRFAEEFHFAITVRVSRDAENAATAPATITADVVVRNGSGAPTFRRTVPLAKRLDLSGADHVLYVSDMATPIVLLDRAVSQSAYPDFIFVVCPADGSVTIEPTVP